MLNLVERVIEHVSLEISLLASAEIGRMKTFLLHVYNIKKKGQAVKSVGDCVEVPNLPSLRPPESSCASHLLSLGVQAEQADKATDLQQEINENGQAGKQRESPHGGHVGQGSCRGKRSSGNYDTEKYPGILSLGRPTVCSTLSVYFK